MKNEYITENYINEGFGKKLGISLIGALMLTAFQIVLGYLITFSRTFKKKYDDDLTKKLIKITGDDKIKIYSIKNDKMNTFTAGGKKLYYFTGLQKGKYKLSERETIAVLLHEYGHAAEDHVKNDWLSAVSGSMISITVAIAVGLVVNEKLKHNSRTVSTVIAFYVWAIVQILVGIPGGKTRKAYDFIADSYAVKYGYKKEMVSALEKIKEYVKELVCDKNKHMTELQCDEEVDADSPIHPSFTHRIEKIMDEPDVKNAIKSGKKLKALNLVHKHIKEDEKSKKAA